MVYCDLLVVEKQYELLWAYLSWLLFIAFMIAFSQALKNLNWKADGKGGEEEDDYLLDL